MYLTAEVFRSQRAPSVNPSGELGDGAEKTHVVANLRAAGPSCGASSSWSATHAVPQPRWWPCARVALPRRSTKPHHRAYRGWRDPSMRTWWPQTPRSQRREETVHRRQHERDRAEMVGDVGAFSQALSAEDHVARQIELDDRGEAATEPVAEDNTRRPAWRRSVAGGQDRWIAQATGAPWRFRRRRLRASSRSALVI